MERMHSNIDQEPEPTFEEDDKVSVGGKGYVVERAYVDRGKVYYDLAPDTDADTPATESRYEVPEEEVEQ